MIAGCPVEVASTKLPSVERDGPRYRGHPGGFDWPAVLKTVGQWFVEAENPMCVCHLLFYPTGPVRRRPGFAAAGSSGRAFEGMPDGSGSLPVSILAPVLVKRVCADASMAESFENCQRHSRGRARSREYGGLFENSRDWCQGISPGFARGSGLGARVSSRMSANTPDLRHSRCRP